MSTNLTASLSHTDLGVLPCATTKMSQVLGGRRINKAQLRVQLLRLERELEQITESLNRHLVKEPEDEPLQGVRTWLGSAERNVSEALEKLPD